MATGLPIGREPGSAANASWWRKATGIAGAAAIRSDGAAIASYADDAGKRAEHGTAARARAEARFSLDAMVRAYMEGLRPRAGST